MTVRSTGENAYFAASNSASGFFSYYEEIFRAAHIRHVYAVKGGPGTGKSRFLRDVAARAQAYGNRCEYIYCSSDPDSLDGVIVYRNKGECIALLDATAPHVFEPLCPGAKEELVDLGAFWNAAELGSRLAEIEGLNAEKKQAYRRAYRYLAGFGEMSANLDSLVSPYVKRGKIRSFAQKLIQGVEWGKEFVPMPALIHSLGMRGEVGFDTYFSMARKLYIIEDCRGAAQYLMAELGELIRERQLKVRISHDPIEPQKIDGLFLCESGLAFVVCRAGECEFPRKKISMSRFVDTAAMRPVRGEVNYAARMCRAMKGGALESLEKVKQVHFCLEEIYAAAMDFKAKEDFTRAFCDKIFG